MRSVKFKQTQVAQAIALGAAFMGSGSVMAQATCPNPSSTTTISTAFVDTCTLGANESLVVTSTGSIVVSGPPAVVVTAVTGNITNGGLIQSSFQGIQIRNPAGFTGSIVNTGTISGTTGIAVTMTGGAATITNSGTINGTNTGIFVSVAGGLTSITNSGTISGTNNGLNMTNTSGTVAVNNTGTISGAVQLGRNTLNLNGSSGVVDGEIIGSTGSTININGTVNRTTSNEISATQINLNSGGVLKFAQDASINSSISGTFTNSGTLGVAPGKTLSVGGLYTQTADGVFKTDVASNTSYGKLLLSESTTLPANAKINVNVIGSPSLTAKTVLSDVIKTSAGTLTSSTFDVTDNSSLFNFKAVKNGNAVDLTIEGGTSVRQSVDDNKNPSSQGIASELDRLTATLTASGLDTLITELGKLATPKEVSDAVKKLLPLMVTSVKQAGFTNVRMIERVIQSRIERNQGLSAGDEVSDRQFWVKPVGAWADQGDLNGVSGFKSNSSGIVFGADNAISDKMRAGGAFSYTTSQVDGNPSSAPNTAKIDSYRLIGYGSYNLDEVTDVHFQADIGISNTKGSRAINFAGATTANSDYQSISAHLSGGVGRSYQMSPVSTFTPTASLSYSRIQDDAYTETGAGALNLKVGANSAEELVAAIEGKLLRNLSDTSKISVNVGAGYDLMAKKNSLSSAFVGGGGTFTTDGLDVAPWSVRGGLGYISMSKTLEVTARYDLELREGSNNQTVSVKFRMPF